jgi:hypothetical protein
MFVVADVCEQERSLPVEASVVDGMDSTLMFVV